ncbi:MAG: glycosyltransferase family 2 protein [Selenomonadaceae bacterium]|nr:glycosyltransferase family 2 protein [Selenomonadaceae bacterium]
MKEDSLISVIVPAYNAGDYIERCLKSILQQTYKNLEIIVVDDGSIDNTKTIVRKYQEKDPRISLIVTENHGVSHARNIALDKVTGEYVGFVDADDWIEPDMYASMIGRIIDDGTDMCICGYKKYYNGIFTYPLYIDKMQVFSREKLITEMFGMQRRKKFYWELCDKLFKRNIVDSIRLDEKITHCEDMLMMWHVLRNVKSVSYTPFCYYIYTYNELSASHKVFTRNALSAWKAIKIVKKMCCKFDESENIKRCVDQLMFNMAISNMVIMTVIDFEGYRDEIIRRRDFIKSRFLKQGYLKTLSLKKKVLCFLVIYFNRNLLHRLLKKYYYQ